MLPLASAVTDPLAILRKPALSSYREQLVEYAFLSEVLQDGWLRRQQPVNVLRADVDAAGYDLVLECQQVIRPVQLKSTVVGGKTRDQKIHSALASQQSGCVVWIVLEPAEKHRVRLTYLALGGEPGSPLGDLSGYPIAKHTKGNAEGIKAERPAIREVPKTAFTAFASIAELSNWLFGVPIPSTASAS